MSDTISLLVEVDVIWSGPGTVQPDFAGTHPTIARWHCYKWYLDDELHVYIASFRKIIDQSINPTGPDMEFIAGQTAVPQEWCAGKTGAETGMNVRVFLVSGPIASWEG